MARREWTPDEDAAVRARYGRVRVADIAAELGRSWCSVNRRALRLGCRSRLRGRGIAATAADLQRLVELHGRGHLDGAVARDLGLHVSSISKGRRRLGLAHNYTCERRARNAALRASRVAEAKAAAGWPAWLRPAQARLLSALLTTGPMTAEELRGAVLPARASRRTITAYMRVLRRAGLVTVLASSAGTRVGVRRLRFYAPVPTFSSEVSSA